MKRDTIKLYGTECKFMSHNLTIYEIREVKQLLSFKIADLIKSKSFIETIRGRKGKKLLNIDMELSRGEIKDLEDLLIVAPW